jgi:acyl-CoA thioester hydrolase
MTDRYQFTLPFEVRDYECDLQGIVNNAVYLRYLEHTRHQFLKRSGLSFAELTKAGINLVVVRNEIDYKVPLRSGDAFIVGLNLERISHVRFGFLQDIYRLAGEEKTLALKAKVICAAMDRSGKPIIPAVIEPLFHAHAGQ